MADLDLSLTADELEAMLNTGRTVRLATADQSGAPQVVPLWFVWVDGAMFMNTTLGNLSVTNLEADPRAAATVDDGDDYTTLRGVVLRGRVVRADEDPRLALVRERWSAKYLDGGPLPYDRWLHRVWLRLDPDRIASWDFRKIPAARSRAPVESEAER